MQAFRARRKQLKTRMFPKLGQRDTGQSANQDSDSDKVNREDRHRYYGSAVVDGSAQAILGDVVYGDAYGPRMVSFHRLRRVLNQCGPKIAAALSRPPAYSFAHFDDCSNDLGVHFESRVLNSRPNLKRDLSFVACGSQFGELDDKYSPQLSLAAPEYDASLNILILAAAGPASTYVTQAILAAKLTDDFGRISIYVSKKTILEAILDAQALEWWGVEVHVGDLDDEKMFKNACQDVDVIVSCLEADNNVPLEKWAEQVGVRRFLFINYSADIQDKTVATTGGKFFTRQMSKLTERMTARCLPENPGADLPTGIAQVRHHSQYHSHDPEQVSSTSVSRILPKRLDAPMYNRLPYFPIREKTLSQTSLVHKQQTKNSLLHAAGSWGSDRPTNIEAMVYSTLLSIAVLIGRTNVVHLLARAGADVNRKDYGTGLTPLHYAVLGRSPEMVRTLLTCGATASLENHPALNHPRFRWVDRIIANIAYGTKTGEILVLSSPVDGEETSKTANGRKRKYADGNQAGVVPVSKNQAFVSKFSPDDRGNQSDEDDEPKKRKRGQVNRELAESYREPSKFACPYSKYDPSRFGDIKCCGLTGYDDVPRLKDHLKRKHRLYSCERCGLASFKNKDELNDHIAADDCVKLVQSQRAYSDGYNTRQADKIEEKWRGQPEKKKWGKIYRILFGVDESDSVPFPYFETRAQLQYENRRLQEALREALGSRYPAEELPRQMDSVMLGIRQDFTENRHQIRDVTNVVSIDDNETAPAVIEPLYVIPVTTSSIVGDRTNEIRPHQEFRIQTDLTGRQHEPDVLEATDFEDELSSWPPDGFGNIFDILNDETPTRESSVSSIDRIWSNDSMTSTELETSVEDTTYDVTTQEANSVDGMQWPTSGEPAFKELGGSPEDHKESIEGCQSGRGLTFTEMDEC